MRLIDADKILKKKFRVIKPSELGVERYYVSEDDINNAPAVDAVHVVRCENCVCYRKVGNLHPYCTLLLREMPANGYCNYGLRKDLEYGTD